MGKTVAVAVCVSTLTYLAVALRRVLGRPVARRGATGRTADGRLSDNPLRLDRDGHRPGAR